MTDREVKELISQHKGLVCSIANNIYARIKYMGNIIEIEDLVNVGLMALCDAYNSYDADRKANSVTYYYMYIRYRMLDYYRRMSKRIKDEKNKKMYVNFLNYNNKYNIRDDRINIEDSVADCDMINHLMKAVSMLDAQKRRCVNMYYFDKISIVEIAELYKCTTSNISFVLKLAKRQIRQYLEGVGITCQSI